MVGTGRTTLGILRFTALGPGSVAIVPAAAGGIGTLLVQYAKNAGATVVGLAGGPAKTALVRENGADLAVDYLEPGWPEEVRAYLAGPSAGVRPRSSSTRSAATPAAPPWISSARAGSTSSSAGPGPASTTASRSPSPPRSWPSGASPRSPSSAR